MKRRVLVGCECSQIVTAAFRARGCEAFSCDLAPSYGDLPEFHFQGDLREVYDFIKPDLFIVHPPCTYLSRAGLCHLVDANGNIKDLVRYELGLIARDFFLWCLSRPADMVCVENPVPIRRFGLPAATQIFEPWYFGEPYTKKTCLWLRGLPPLSMTAPVRPRGSWTDLHRSQRLRSQTFKGVASAMADAWSGDLDGLQLLLFA